jgi:uncharacterized membrane protein
MSSIRYPFVDALRGVAIVLMMAYHFTFDLDYFHVVDIDFNNNAFWLFARSLIVSMFLGLVGISLYLASVNGVDKRRYWRRIGVLLGCALAVSLASYLMFPKSLIFFGILHFIVIGSLLGVLFLRFYWVNLLLGCGFIAAGLWIHHPLFDQSALQWIGLMTHKPVTEDYVPLFPWFGVVLLGLFLGRSIYSGPVPSFACWRCNTTIGRVLTVGGRHSLIIYMLHQPLFIGILYLFLSG